MKPNIDTMINMMRLKNKKLNDITYTKNYISVCVSEGICPDCGNRSLEHKKLNDITYTKRSLINDFERCKSSYCSTKCRYCDFTHVRGDMKR